MGNDFEIGRVITVDTAQVTVELNPDLKALTRSTYEGAYEIGRINSYIIIPVGAHRLVAMITKVVLAEEAEIVADRTMVTLPSARRLLKAILIGTIDGEDYTQGVTLFPILDNPVHMVTEDDLRIIFDYKRKESLNPEDPGFCVHLGESPVFSGYPIKINPDSFFGKHVAIIGSTGSGKSCTIASLIQSILVDQPIRQSNFIILDTNGEYRSAFQQQKADGSWTDIKPQMRCLYIPSDQTQQHDKLIIPYWFMNSDDFIRLFNASAGIQRPVLLDALRLSRSEVAPRGAIIELREILLRDLHRLMAQVEDRGKVSAEVEDIASGCLRYLEGRDDVLGELLNDRVQELKDVLASTRDNARTYVGEPDARRFSKPLPLDVQQKIQEGIRPIIQKLINISGCGDVPFTSADSPIYFAKDSFRREHIERAMQRDQASGARARDYCATMLMRIYRLFEDRRFEFLFGPTAGQWPSPEHSLATFLRDIIGLPSAHNPLPPLSDSKSVPDHVLPFYDRQRNKSGGHNIVIIDLSLLASEVLENVTALIGRLILEFLQRMGELGDENARGSLPVVLILEEAQNYIREQRFGDEESISRTVFERIAREGRKFGLSLVVASQRPSELSKTVLSQCNSFIVHRLQNPEDLRYFKDIVPGIYDPLLEQLPALEPRTAIVLGECVRAPALVRIQEANPVPRSRDPKFYRYWVAETPQSPDVEKICRLWEAKTEETSLDEGTQA